MAFKKAILRGRKREAVMRAYWSGRISAVQAGRWIGVSWRMVCRDSPPEFDWRTANDDEVDRFVAGLLKRVKE